MTVALLSRRPDSTLESISFLITGTSLVRAGLMVNGMAPSTIAAGAMYIGGRPPGRMGQRAAGAHGAGGRRSAWGGRPPERMGRAAAGARGAAGRDAVTVRGRGATGLIRKGLER